MKLPKDIFELQRDIDKETDPVMAAKLKKVYRLYRFSLIAWQRGERLLLEIYGLSQRL